MPSDSSWAQGRAVTGLSEARASADSRLDGQYPSDVLTNEQIDVADDVRGENDVAGPSSTPSGVPSDSGGEVIRVLSLTLAGKRNTLSTRALS
jgi:hypothetical protein